MADTATATFDKPAWQAENELRTKELTDKLEAGIKDLFSSDKYKDYLKSMSRFHNYSSRNVMLIHQQMPNASRVASFKLWSEKFNRQVKKGEKSLRIFAPIEIKPEKKMMEKLDPETGAPMVDANGKVIMEEMTALTSRSIAFKLVPVFDVSQTYGEPLPQLAEDLTGNVEHYEAFLDTLKEICPLPIEFEPMDENMDGYCRFGEKIGIREGMSEIQTISAIIHEITHSRLHDREQAVEGSKQAPKEVREIEAESVSYVVCQKYGIETGDNSFGYLATWGSRDLNEVKASLDTIRKEANTVINSIDDRFMAICKERGIDLTVLEKAVENAPTQAVETPVEPTYTTETTTETIAGVDFTVNEVVPTVAKTLEQRNYEKLADMFPNIANGDFMYQRNEAGGGFMPLSLEWIDTDKLSVMHTYTQNGDLMYDPMIVYEIDQEAKTATAIEFQQSLPPLYQRVDEDGIGHSIDGNGNERTINSLQGQINDFTSQWFENIGNQNFMPVSAILRDEERHDPSVYFNSDKKPFGMAFMYENDGTTVFNHMDKDEKGMMTKIAFVDSFRSVTFFDENLPKDITAFVPTVKLINEQSKQAEIDRQSAAFYHLGSGPTENGIEVWNWNETEHKDGTPKFLATVNFDREITYLDDTLPDDVQFEIKRLSTANWKEYYATEMAGMDYDPPPPSWEKEFMPDPSISVGDRDEYGYIYDDMLPLKYIRAEELYNQDHTIFLLYEDGTESMAYDLDEMKNHEGIFGIEREDWQKSKEYRENENKVNQQQEAIIESGFINAKEDTYAIYQIMDGVEKARDVRFEGLNSLEQRGLEVNRNNYVVVHTEPLTPDTTLEGIFQKFNVDPPKDFSGHSLSVSDVVVLNKGGEITSHFVDSFGFAELPAFLGVEKQHEQAAPAVAQSGIEPPQPPTAPPELTSPEIPKNEQPIYKHSADHALETDELQAWRDSRDLNGACGRAIDKAINASNYEEYRYDLATAARAVIDEFGAERVAWVLASNVNYNENDGRLTNASRDWAKGINTEKPDYHLQSHKTLIEGFVEKFRKVEKEKPSLMATIAQAEKQSKADFDGKAQPGLDAPDKSKKNTGMEV